MKKVVFIPIVAILLSISSFVCAIEDKNIAPVLEELKGGVDESRIEPDESASPIKRWLEGDYVTGDWGGSRTLLEEHGVTFETTYMVDTLQKVYGGIQKSKYPVKSFGLLDSAVILETEKMGLWKGGTAVVRFQNKHGVGINDPYIGAYQYINAYDMGQFAHLAEYWYQQALFDNRIEIKVGKQEACYDFMELNLATNFLNNSHAFFMPNVPLPSYPDQALGLVLKVNPTKWLSLRSGWYDGNAKGGTLGFDTAFGKDKASFLIQEVGIRHNKGNMPGTILAGGWLHTGHVEELDTGKMRAQTLGWYVEAEQMLWKEKKDYKEDTQGFYALAQVSMSPNDRVETPKYYGGALMYKGLFKKRDEDVFGIGTAIAQFSSKLKGVDGRSGAENIIEAFYKIQMTPWMSLQPTVQYIHRANGHNANGCAIGLRTMISF